MTSHRLERLLIAAVAAHSLVLGAAMLLRPAWTLDMAGWEYEGPSFFPSQSGLFLLILGAAYLAAIWHRPLVWLLVASKAGAVVFLLTEYALGNAPGLMLPAALFDGLMGLAVATVVWWNRRTQEAVDP